MKCLSVWLVLLTFDALSIAAQDISLDIPHHHVDEAKQTTFTTYTTKKYYFVTFFKVIKIVFCLQFD